MNVKKKEVGGPPPLPISKNFFIVQFFCTIVIFLTAPYKSNIIMYIIYIYIHIYV